MQQDSSYVDFPSTWEADQKALAATIEKRVDSVQTVCSESKEEEIQCDPGVDEEASFTFERACFA